MKYVFLTAKLRVELHYWNFPCVDTICYDDGCHLKRYAQNQRAELTETAKRIATCSIVIDKMHFKGHSDAWCLHNCNPYELEQLRKVRHCRFGVNNI